MKPLMYWICDWRLIMLSVFILLAVKLFTPISWWFVALPIIFPLALLTILGLLGTIGVVVGMLGKPKLEEQEEQKEQKEQKESEDQQ